MYVEPPPRAIPIEAAVPSDEADGTENDVPVRVREDATAGKAPQVVPLPVATGVEDAEAERSRAGMSVGVGGAAVVAAEDEGASVASIVEISLTISLGFGSKTTTAC